MAGLHGSRRHRRVARKSRYDQWIVDAFPGLIRGWPLDDPTGASAFREVTGSGDTASISGTYALQQGSLVGGVAGSVRTDGSTAIADAGDIGAMDVGSSDSATFMFWVDDMPPTDGNNPHPFGKPSRPASNTGWRMIIVDFDGNYFLRFRMDDSDSTVATDGNPRTQSEFNDAGPVCLTAVVDRSNSQMRVYFNGTQEGSADISGIGDVSNTDGVDIARGDNQAFDCHHFYAFDNALSDAEITALYEQGAEFFDRGRLL